MANRVSTASYQRDRENREGRSLRMGFSLPKGPPPVVPRSWAEKRQDVGDRVHRLGSFCQRRRGPRRPGERGDRTALPPRMLRGSQRARVGTGLHQDDQIGQRRQQRIARGKLPPLRRRTRREARQQAAALGNFGKQPRGITGQAPRRQGPAMCRRVASKRPAGQPPGRPAPPRLPQGRTRAPGGGSRQLGSQLSQAGRAARFSGKRQWQQQRRFRRGRGVYRSPDRVNGWGNKGLQGAGRQGADGLAVKLPGRRARTYWRSGSVGRGRWHEQRPFARCRAAD